MRAHTQVHLIEVRGSVSFVSVCWSPPGPSRVIGGDSARRQPAGHRLPASRAGPQPAGKAQPGTRVKPT